MPDMEIRIWMEFYGGPKLVIKRQTGVFYENQTSGYGCMQREIEGFLIPFDSSEAEKELELFFKRFRGAPYGGRYLFGDQKDIDELAQLIQRFSLLQHALPERDFQAVFDLSDLDDQYFLELDQQRIDELEEGWIPVKTISGSGILAFKNCD